MSKIAVYPGSFDPVTNGHVDIIRRTSRLFDRVIVAVSNNAAKNHTFSVNERIQMLVHSTPRLGNVSIDSFSGLLVDYLHSKKAQVLIRGLRVVSDMDYEFQMASINRQLYPKMETVFLMPDERYTYLSSSIIKEVARLGAQIKSFLPPPACRMLYSRLKQRNRKEES